MLKIGVLGCASIAERSVIPAILAVPELKLVAVASRSSAKADVFAKKFGCEAITGYDNLVKRDDIDVIYMPLPTGLHEEWVIKSLNAGKHLLVEKSFALNFSSAKKMVALARSRKLLVMENFMFLYHGQHSLVKSIISNGEIGSLRCFRASFGFPPLSPDNFRYDESLGGGSLLDAGAYTLKASQLYLGQNISVAAAVLNSKRSSVDIYGGAFLKNSYGLFAEVGFGFDNFYQCNYELWGSMGKIVVHRAFTPKPNYEPTITVEKPNGTKTTKASAENHFVNLLQEFIRCINQNDMNDKWEEILNQSRLLDEVKAVSRL